ncbi:hypothetical protein ACO0LB_17950 [Undibacterium sp. SXout7W]|uniref:hypothetical protein n=1 Tax=Undibacterium sp. SXout7W TaxID=3413049 RepID=UPI003BF2F85B
MSKLIDAIERANVKLLEVGLPRYDKVVELLQAAENRLEAMKSSHKDTASNIAVLREKLDKTLKNFPYP